MSRLGAGDRAPMFRATDLFDNPVDLAAWRESTVFLSFFRNAACAICNLRVHQLIEQHDELARAGVQMVAVFESTAAAMRQYVGRQGAPFPLVPDPDGRLYTLYGLESSQAKVATTMEMPATAQVIADAAARGFALTEEAGSNFLRMPADFLIDPRGTIIRAHYSNYVWDHTPLPTITSLLVLSCEL